VARQVFLEPEEEKIIRELLDKGVEVEIRPLADDPKVEIQDVL
jgi:fructoselysine/glucoselysine PTS system EIIB component